jgi:hypothetical protein
MEQHCRLAHVLHSFSVVGTREHNQLDNSPRVAAEIYN